MKFHEALNKFNYYLSIFLIVTIISLYTGKSLNILKEHILLMLIIEIVFIAISSIVIYKLFEWCYVRKKPKIFFNFMKNRRIKKTRDKFDKLYEMDDDGNRNLIMGYIDNAINEVRSNSSEKSKVLLALDQLLELVDEDEDIRLYILNSLSNALEYHSDQQIIHSILSVICFYQKSLNKNI